MRNVEIGRVAEALLTVDLLYEEGAKGDFPPVVRNVYIDHVSSKSSPRLFFMVGFKAATIDNINVSDSTFEGVEETEVMNNVGKVTLNRVTIVPLKKARSLSSREGSP
jgi:unsaturated rhamnogalacturonyl hydrolase